MTSGSDIDIDIDYLALEYQVDDRWTLALPALGLTLVFTGGFPDWPHEFTEYTLARWPRVLGEARARLRARLLPPARPVDVEFDVRELHIPADEPSDAINKHLSLLFQRVGDPDATWIVGFHVTDFSVDTSIVREPDAIYFHAKSITRRVDSSIAPSVPVSSDARRVDHNDLDWIPVSPMFAWVAEPALLGLSIASFHVHVIERDGHDPEQPDPDRFALAGLVLNHLGALLELALQLLRALVQPYEPDDGAPAVDDWYIDTIDFGRPRTQPPDEFTLGLKRRGDIYGLFVVTYQFIGPPSARRFALRSICSTSH